MDNAFDELTQALQVAREVERASSKNAEAMAALLQGNLKSVSQYRLRALKKELDNYNMHTGRWKK